MKEPLAIYVHTPFCPSKCGYCDFNSYAMDGEIIQQTVDATIEEIRRSPWRGVPAKTIFFGGGTPTFLTSQQLVSIFAAVTRTHPPIENAEITSEANPGTVDAEKFAAMHKSGFNRISLGAQSFFEDDLLRLGRVHRAGEIERAVSTARQAGFENLNLDLMFALPGQTDHAWRQNLRRAIDLDPEHLSLYCLTLEPNTAFYKQHLRGDLVVPEDEAQVEMYETACEAASQRGYAQYEISNFAKPGFACQHNLAYWRTENYIAYGPGAVGCMPFDDKRIRYTNLKHPQRYVDAMANRLNLWCESDELTPENERIEAAMLGLRLNEGLVNESCNSGAVERLKDRGWIEPTDDRLRLTALGRHFCTEATLELIGQ